VTALVVVIKIVSLLSLMSAKPNMSSCPRFDSVLRQPSPCGNVRVQFFFLPKNKTILVQSQLADSRTGPRCIRSYSYISFRTEFNALQRTTPSLLIVATVSSTPLYALLYFTSFQVVMRRTDTVYCLFSGHQGHPLLCRLDLSCFFSGSQLSLFIFLKINYVFSSYSPALYEF